jgi:hypothetical protein
VRRQPSNDTRQLYRRLRQTDIALQMQGRRRQCLNGKPTAELHTGTGLFDLEKPNSESTHQGSGEGSVKASGIQWPDWSSACFDGEEEEEQHDDLAQAGEVGGNEEEGAIRTDDLAQQVVERGGRRLMESDEGWEVLRSFDTGATTSALLKVC